MGSRVIYKNNPKKRWELINNITGRKQYEDNFKALVKPDGSRTKNALENAEVHASRLQETCSLAPDPQMDEGWRACVLRIAKVGYFFLPSLPNVE